MQQLPLLISAVEVTVLGDRGAVGGGPFPGLDGLSAVPVQQPHISPGRVLQRELLPRGAVVGVLNDRLGVAKRGALALQWPEPALDLHEQIKRLFDPKGLLNPGKKLARG